MISYLMHATILLSGVMIFYWLLLRNETFFALNRWIFVSCIALSFLLPLISVPASMSLQPCTSKVVQAFEAYIPNSPTAPIDNAAEASVEDGQPTTIENFGPLSVKSLHTWSLKSILVAIYIIGVLIFSVVFFLQLIILMTRKYNLPSIKTGKYTIVELVKDQEPYSFMNTIFINPNSYDPETYEQIIEHEKLHIDQVHFLDKLLAEILVILFWFNPLIWLMRSSIGKNLEFLTDYTLLKKGMEKESYQMSLLKVSVSTKPFNLTTSYNNSFLKNRIIMMNSKKSSIASLWKYLFIIPLFFLSLISLNAVSEGGNQMDFKEKPQEITNTYSENGKGNPNSKAESNPQENSQSKPQSNPKENAQSKPESNPQEQANKSNGKIRMEKRELNLEQITAFNIGSNANVVVTQGNSQKITVEGPSDVLDKLNQEVKGGSWNIKIDADKWSNADEETISVTMSLETLNAVAISGRGNIAGRGTFKPETKGMNIAISGQGNIALDVDVQNTNCAISGQGNIDVKGSSKTVSIAVSGDGNISTVKLDSDDVRVAVSGSAEVAVNAEKSLTTSVSGSAVIKYTGNPALNSKASGHADVSRM